MKEEIATLSQKLSKKTMELQKKENQLKEANKSLDGFTKEITQF